MVVGIASLARSRSVMSFARTATAFAPADGARKEDNMASNFYVWTQNFSKRSACSYYRIEVPMGQMRDLDFCNLYMDDGKVDNEESNLARMYSDVAHYYAINGPGPLHEFRTLKKIQPAVRDGKDIYPPALIYDIDDNNDFVHPFNTSFAEQGTRGFPDARLLKPEDGGLMITDHNGKEIAAWVDKVTKYNGVTFDIARNLAHMKMRHQLIREAHGVTVCSPTLKRYMEQVIGAKNVHVHYNTIVPEHFENIRAVRTDNKIRILWQGGMSHWIDWYPLREAVKAISEKYRDQITWVIFGEWFKWIHDAIPDDMVEHHQWVEYDAYKLKRGLLNVDINLCPLKNNVFNSCKSAIKWYEASIWEQPEATLAQVGPSHSEMVDGETAIMFKDADEFVTKLSLLIDSADLRKKVAEGARAWVLANRTPKQTIPALYDFYVETRARQRRDLGRPMLKAPTLEQIKKVARPILR
jgi:glycosyltransferase involved in cell wall biosynthesis